MCQVVNLFGYSTDRRYTARIKAVQFARVQGVCLSVKLITDGEPLPTDWLATLRWRVTHVPSGRKATAGGERSILNVKIRSRDEGGITLNITPFFPSLGTLEMNEQFRIDIWTPSGRHLWFLNTPTVSDRLAAKIRQAEQGGRRHTPRTSRTERGRKRPSHLQLIR